MFAYPKQAYFGHSVPKSKIYAHAKPSRRIKDLFVQQVEEIIWKYKLAPETVNLASRNGINEIQVFEIHLKQPALDDAVLQTIDKTIQFPVSYEVIHNDSVTFVASYKRLNETDTSKWVIEALFKTQPQPSGAPREPLPVTLDLAGLYEHIVRRHIPLAYRTGEGLAELVTRFKELETKKRLQEQLETKLVQEKQFNRKVELNSQLRGLAAELAALQK